MPTPKELGDRAEQLVADWLVSRGTKLVARNLRLGSLELDIVARENGLILIVEVRTRGGSSWTSGLQSISHTKRQRLRRAGERLWNRRYRLDQTAERMRFDVAIVTFGEQEDTIEYIAAAF